MISVAFAFISFFVLLLLVKKIGRTFANAALLLVLVWSIYILASMLGTNGHYKWNYAGVIWLIFMLYLYSIFYFLGNRYVIKGFTNRDLYIDVDHSEFHISKTAWSMLYILVFLAFAKWAYELKINGFHLAEINNINALASMNHELAVARYAGDSQGNTVLQLLNVATYAAPACGGFSLNFAIHSTQRWISLISLIPILFVTLTNNTKAGLIGGGYALHNMLSCGILLQVEGLDACENKDGDIGSYSCSSCLFRFDFFNDVENRRG